MGKSGSNGKLNSASYQKLVSVLTVLSRNNVVPERPRQYQITELADEIQNMDEKEIQRCLFILEGQKLVSPYPNGDFTSKIWQITNDGIKAVRELARVTSEAA